MTRLLTILSLTAIFSQQSAEAKNCRALDVFTEGMTLSKDQRQINQDLTGVYKEKALVTQNFHADRLEMMVDFVQGSLSRDGVMAKTTCRTNPYRTHGSRQRGPGALHRAARILFTQPTSAVGTESGSTTSVLCQEEGCQR